MFTKYVCEECGKIFNEESKARECEKEHEEFKKAAEAAEAERKSKLDEIKAIEALLKGKIDAYEETYGLKYVPKIHTDCGSLTEYINSLLEEMFGA